MLEDSGNSCLCL